MTSPSQNVLLGYEVGSGNAVAIPLNGHICVTGMTQAAGKTTTLEALITRSHRRALCFVTKKAEGSFVGARRIPPYFRQRADWQFVASILEATLRERMKFERAWIMRASKGARTLEDVARNVTKAMVTARGMSADIYYQLHEYLQIVVPQVATLPPSSGVLLQPFGRVAVLITETFSVPGGAMAKSSKSSGRAGPPQIPSRSAKRLGSWSTWAFSCATVTVRATGQWKA
jgi:hypothetical protein